MKKLPIVLIASIIFLFGACTKSDLNKEESLNSITNSSNAKTFVEEDNRGIYINNTEDIIVSDPEIGELLDWCAFHEFNHITLYNIGSILSDPVLTLELKEFVVLAKSVYNLKVAFSSGGLTSLEKIGIYCSENAPIAQPDGITTEYEFWNAGYSFSYFLDMVDQIKMMNEHFGPWENNFYISKFEDEAMEYSDYDVLKRVVYEVKEIDALRTSIFLVNYRNNAQNFPGPGNMYNRYQDLANMAKNFNYGISVLPLFNVKHTSGDPHIFEYFDEDDATDDGYVGENHEFEEAFLNFKDGFDVSSIINKDYIRLRGFQIYRYSEAREARGF